MILNSYLLPFGYIPGKHGIKCQRCKGCSSADKAATHCMACAKLSLKEAIEEIDASVKLRESENKLTLIGGGGRIFSCGPEGTEDRII